MAANCTAKCKGSDRKQMMCCFTDCAMDSVGVLTNGKFDATKSKQILAKLTDKSWTPEVIEHFKTIVVVIFFFLLSDYC